MAIVELKTEKEKKTCGLVNLVNCLVCACDNYGDVAELRAKAKKENRSIIIFYQKTMQKYIVILSENIKK